MLATIDTSTQSRALQSTAAEIVAKRYQRIALWLFDLHADQPTHCSLSLAHVLRQQPLGLLLVYAAQKNLTLSLAHEVPVSDSEISCSAAIERRAVSLVVSDQIQPDI